jgi:hypothetical protein
MEALLLAATLIVRNEEVPSSGPISMIGIRVGLESRLDLHWHPTCTYAHRGKTTRS